jgi:hypothetical protein
VTPAKMALYDRVVEVLGSYDPTPEERMQILKGTGDAESWAQVPLGVQHLIAQIEKSPRQSWDDPADLPDQQNL